MAGRAGLGVGFGQALERGRAWGDGQALERGRAWGTGRHWSADLRPGLAGKLGTRNQELGMGNGGTCRLWGAD